MASVSIVPSMPPYDPDAEIGASVGPRWKVWLQDFETFLVGNDITDNKRKRALLLYQAGSRVREIFRQLSDTVAAYAYQPAVTKLTGYFEPQTHRLYEVYKFRQAVQQPNETLGQFHVRLLHLAQTCEFSDSSLDFEIQLQIVIGANPQVCVNKLSKILNTPLKICYWTVAERKLVLFKRQISRVDSQGTIYKLSNRRVLIYNKLQHENAEILVAIIHTNQSHALQKVKTVIAAGSKITSLSSV